MCNSTDKDYVQAWWDNKKIGGSSRKKFANI